MNYTGNAFRIDDYDLPRIASTIGVGEDELHAFMDIEAAGSGFDSKGRPKMLFEPARFYAELGAGANRDLAVKQGLARKTWRVNGKVPKYPNDSYPLLVRAARIDSEAAHRSCSWGLTQILGTWHKELGYPKATDMVMAFADNEDAHLEATVKLLTLWKLDDDLRALAALKRPTEARDCAIIAKAWNGPGYATHNYHGRMAAAHNRWRKIRDTPWSKVPEIQSIPITVSVPEPEPAVIPKVIKTTQIPHVNKPKPIISNTGMVLSIIIIGIGATWTWISAVPCNLVNLFCGN